MPDSFVALPPKQLSGLSLAFVGDSVYDLLVKKRILENGNMPVKKLHTEAVKYVSAAAQASVYEPLKPLLSPEELDILLRGRNAATGHQPKSATTADYHRATAIEALFGYLYLSGMDERLNELFHFVFQTISGVNAVG